MKKTILIFLSISLLESLCFAETHISGNVSGVWGPEGNPYIADSTVVVPAGQELQIMPGVEMYFTAYQNFNIYGKVTAIGMETDSIYFLWSGCNDTTFERIYLYYADTCRFSYCVINKPHQSFYSIFSKIILEYSNISDYFSLVNTNSGGIISNCYLQTHIDNTIYCTIEISYNYFNTIPQSGILDIGYSFYCIGDITNNNCVNGIGVGGNHIGNVIDNRMGSFTAGNNINTMMVENNEIFYNGTYNSGKVSLNNCDNIFLKNNSFTFLNIISELECVYNFENNTISEGVKIQDDSSHAIFNDNLIIEGIVLCWGASADFINNTIVLYETNMGIDAASSSQIGSLGEVRNNVILGSNNTGVGIDGAGSGNIAYNCIYGFASSMVNIQSASNNIIENPQLYGGDPYEYYLQANSPCIDTGDPASPLDPDSSRCDIGAFYYDHNADNPPVISSPTSCYATIGTEFVYVATATDDNGLASLVLTELPLWLTEEQIDWVSDTVVVSGIVPEDQDDFSFLITAEDAIGQIDTQRVQVEVTGYHILAGEISGILSLEDSPYLCIADIEVPESDTLTIEPGVEIYFRHYPFNFMKPVLYIYGVLYAQGTETDSIFFVSEDSIPSESDWIGLNFRYQSEDTVKLSYCMINNAHDGIYCDSIKFISLDHCRFELNQTSVFLYYSSGEINHSIFSQTMGILAYYSDSLLVQGNDFFDLNEYNGVEVHHANALITDNYINNGWSGIDIDYYSEAIAARNTIIDCFQAIWIANGASADIYNNSLVGISVNSPYGITYAGADTASIINNIVTGFYYGIEFFTAGNVNVRNNNVFNNLISNYYNAPEELGVLITTNTNGDSCDIYNNISLDPQFIGGEPFDYNLALGSPCIDAGADVGFPYYSNAPDIGALESNYSGVDDAFSILPLAFSLEPCYPNPFNQAARINYTIAKDSRVKILVYNILGEQVQVLQDGILSPGNHSILFHAENFSSGIYFVKMECPSENFTQLRKAVIVK